MAQIDGTSTSSPNRLLGTVFGAVYVLVGLIGFAVTSGVGFAETNSDKAILGIFEVNPLHNIVHLAIGATLIIAARNSEYASRMINGAVGATYLLVGVLGLFILDSEANILSLNAADNGLHFASAAVLLGVSVLGARGTTIETTTRTRAGV